jgi:hypothetical protein
MRRLTTGLAIAGALALGIALAPPASASVSAKLTSVRLGAPYAKAPTTAVIVAKVTQTSYADISFDVTLEGFRASRSMPYADGPCPASVAVVDANVTVTKCGWEQEDGSATLRLALSGTLTSGKVKVKIASGALTAPSKAGTYAVSVSSWAFDTQTADVTVSSGPVK